MDLEKRYTDCFALDKKVDIMHMVRHHPEWAANRIQVGERALAMLNEQQRRAAENSGAVANEPPTAAAAPCCKKYSVCVLPKGDCCYTGDSECFKVL